jgi:hypothetical protein
MRRRFTIIVSLLLAAMAFGAPAAPMPPRNTVCRPTFTTATGPFSAGTAFVCEYPEGKGHVLITAQHLFGPGGGLPAKIAWNEMADKIKQVDGVSMHDPAVHLVSTNVVPIEGAHALDQKGPDGDIAVFALLESKDRATLKLGDKTPKVGDPVWLYGCQAGGKTVELLPAIVSLSTDKELDYTFDDKAIQMRATSGAPILDADGNVVAINIGSTTRRAKLVGFGNPLASIRAHLEHAFAKK